MIQPINSAAVSSLLTNSPLGVESPEEASQSFKNLLLESIGQVNEMQLDADRAVESLMTGGDANPAEVLTAVQKADLAFRMMMQMRNKVMEVYQQVQDVRI